MTTQLTKCQGLDTVATGSSVSEITALLSFYNDTTTQQVINNGPIRIIASNLAVS